MSEFKKFLRQSKIIASNETHRLKILKAVHTHDLGVERMKALQFIDWPKSRNEASQIKRYVLENLPELLESFEKRIKEGGAQVFWALDVKEASNIFLSIVKKYKTKRVIKSKSMTTEEIDLNQLCAQNDIDVWESDLGELIVQLAGEKPYHIVTPAMHKSKQEIADLFHSKLGKQGDDASSLTLIAREHLRNEYVRADMGVTGANFLIADTGAVVVTENEGNARLSTACPPVHVVFAGIEKILPRLEDLSLFLPLLATSGTGQQITCYNSIIKGPKVKEEVDGPHTMIVILIDNGRSRLFANPKMREALKCIRCGSCLNVCPVYRTIGGHTYNTTYQGPIGSVISPLILDSNKWQHLSSASTLCAACRDVCPVNINIPDLLLENRYASTKVRSKYGFWQTIIRFWSYIFQKRSRLNQMRKIILLIQKIYPFFIPKNRLKQIPKIAKNDFRQLWRNNGF